MVSGASLAMLAAQASAVGSDPSRFTKPMRSASAPVMVSAARRMARAVLGPARVATRWTVQWLTIRPSLAAGMPKLAPAVATRRSQATASWVPAPSAAPLTAAMVGNGTSRRPSSTPWRRVANEASSTPVRSAPAQKWPSAPVSTRTRVGRAAAASMAAVSWASVSWSTALRRSGRSSVRRVMAWASSMISVCTVTSSRP